MVDHDTMIVVMLSIFCKSRDPSIERAGDYTLGNVYKIKMALFNLETLHYALTTDDG